VKAKGIDNVCNKKIKNFPKVEKEVVAQVQEVFRVPNRQYKKEHSQDILQLKQ
jgi:hypothetical protein